MTEETDDQTTEWLGTAATAKQLGITTRTLYRFLDEGALASYRFGRVIRIKKSDIDTFVTSCKVVPGTLKHLYPPTVPTDS